MPPVPLVALLPKDVCKAKAPIDNVPKVCVIPAPAVARLDIIIEFAVTVVL